MNLLFKIQILLLMVLNRTGSFSLKGFIKVSVFILLNLSFLLSFKVLIGVQILINYHYCFYEFMIIKTKNDLYIV